MFWWLVQNPFQIGGPRQEVKIDKSLIAKIKDYVGREMDRGGSLVEGGPTEVLVADTSAATLLNIIQIEFYQDS